MADPMSEPAVGIDLGTTHSVIAHLDRSGRPATIQNREGDATTPSVVFFDRTSVVVGKEAVKASQFQPESVAQFAKRDVGRSVYQRLIRGERLPPEVIQALVLQKLRNDAERIIGEFANAVITVPAFFNEPRRKSTQDAGRLAGLEVLDIINEPTAAAIAFGVQQGFLTNEAETKERERILVYDLGGGTFDATLMDIDGNNYNAVATLGDVQLGGMDWDGRIADFVAEHFADRYGVDPRSDTAVYQSLLLDAEDAKHSLSAREEVSIHFAHEGHRARITLTREKFESLTRDLVERTRFTVKNLLHDAGLAWGDLTRVILVGGSTRMPMIERMLRQESGSPVDSSLSPDEAVAHGAAIYAGLLTTSDESKRPKLTVRNVNSHDLGVLGIDPKTKRRRRQVLIPRNTPLPTTGSGRFVTRQESQPNVKVDVIEGGDASGNGATAIGKCVIDDLPPGLPAGSQIDIFFSYAQDGRLTVRAHLPDVDRKAIMSIERASGLSDTLLQQWERRMREGLQLGDHMDQEPVPAPIPPRPSTEAGLADEDFEVTAFLVEEDEPEPPPIVCPQPPPTLPEADRGNAD